MPLTCPFCQSVVTIEDSPNTNSDGMFVDEYYDNDVEFFEGPMKIIQCVKNEKHYCYISVELIEINTRG